MKKILYILLIAALITTGMILLKSADSKQQTVEEEEEVEEVGREDVEASIKLAGESLKNDLKPNGQFNYIYYPSTDTYSEDYNITRHISASNTLIDLYKFTKDETYLESAKKSIDFFMQYLVIEGENAYIIYDNENTATGNQALAVITLINYENETGETSYDTTIEKLANFLLFIQNEDGSYKNYYPQDAPDYAIATELFTGETNLAMISLLEKTGETKYLSALEKSYEFVKTYFEETYSSPIVSWNSMAFAKLYTYTGDEKYADLVIKMTEWLRNLQYKEDNIDEPTYIGGFRAEAPDEWLTCTTAAFGEGVNAGLAVVRATGDTELEEKYDETIRLTVKYLLSVQFKKGGFMASPSKDEIRIDFTTHSIMTMLGAMENYVY